MKHILIVEDDPNMQMIYKSMFEEKTGEYEIEIESDARKAFRKVSENKYDLILLDIIMEPMDGESFFACIRQDPEKKTTPVIVISVLDSAGLDYMKKLEKVDFLQKPVTSEQLFEKIDSML